MTVTVINSYKEFKEIIDGDKPAVFDFWATWCGPCRVISPIFDKFSGLGELSGVGFYKVDVDAQPEISQEVGIRAMPTFIAFQNGQKKGELVGANPGALEKLVKETATLA